MAGPHLGVQGRPGRKRIAGGAHRIVDIGGAAAGDRRPGLTSRRLGDLQRRTGRCRNVPATNKVLVRRHVPLLSVNAGSTITTLRATSPRSAAANADAASDSANRWDTIASSSNAPLR